MLKFEDFINERKEIDKIDNLFDKITKNVDRFNENEIIDLRDVQNILYLEYNSKKDAKKLIKKLLKFNPEILYNTMITMKYGLSKRLEFIKIMFDNKFIKPDDFFKYLKTKYPAFEGQTYSKDYIKYLLSLLVRSKKINRELQDEILYYIRAGGINAQTMSDKLEEFISEIY